MNKKEVFDTVVGFVYCLGLLAAGYYAGSKRAVKTCGDLDNKQHDLESRMHFLELRQSIVEEAKG